MRRSTIRPFEASARPRLRSPYRCRDCGERFWVASRRANYLAGFGGIVIVAGAFAWNTVGVPNEPSREPATKAQAFAETLMRAEREDPTAEFTVSRLYAHGDGVAANRSAALTWLERAAGHGNAEAQYELGNAFREGIRVVQDYERAMKWLQLAAASGNADAQYALGQMHRSGMGVPADSAKAYMWFNLAAAQDVPGAVVQRDAVLRSLSPAEILEAQAEARRLSIAPAEPSATVQ